jgi:calcium/calmodulin-dependent protein kinase I
MNKSPLMKKVLNLFKKTHETNDESPPYPADLERTYRISKRVLGVGSFAVVKECFHKQTGQPFALKIILKKAIAGRLRVLCLIRGTANFVALVPKCEKLKY